MARRSAHAWSVVTNPPSRTVRSRGVRAGLGLTLLTTGLLGCGGGDDADEATAVPLEGLVTERVGEYVHVREGFDLEYPTPAPSGGDHIFGNTWLTCGVYEGEVPDELAIHSLEHGAVWIALGPDSTAEDRELATEAADGRRVVVSDVPDLPNPVELVAWGFRLPLESVDDPRTEAFIEEFLDAPTAPEAGAACDGAFGEPPNPPDLPTG